jgi:hypothetical protein
MCFGAESVGDRVCLDESHWRNPRHRPQESADQRPPNRGPPLCGGENVRNEEEREREREGERGRGRGGV